MSRFETTQWTLVLAAGGDDSLAARQALESLCARYWYPLYAYLRRRGESPDDARDLTQGFLASLLARRSFDDLSPNHGRFRAFLLASLKHYALADATARRAQKRGGGVPPLPLDVVVDRDDAERRYRLEPADPSTPETLYARRWALTIIERVLDAIRVEWAADGRTDEFEALRVCLLGDAPAGGYRAVAAAMGSTEGAVKTAVHRLRRRFQAELRAQIAETVSDPAGVDDEIRHLVRALGT